MLTKQQKWLQWQFIKGNFDIHKAARKLGYRGERLAKGMTHIRDVMLGMHLPFQG